jgi:hypothetical protein
MSMNAALPVLLTGAVQADNRRGLTRSPRGLEASEMVIAGIAMGYADTTSAAADIRQPRVVLDDYATCRGFPED